MVAPVPPDKMTMRLATPAPPASGFGATVSSGRPPFNITIEAADGATLLVLREVNGRLVAEGDESRWDERFVRYLQDDPEQRGTRWLRLAPASLVAKDLSYAVGPLGT